MCRHSGDIGGCGRVNQDNPDCLVCIGLLQSGSDGGGLGGVGLANTVLVNHDTLDGIATVAQ